MMASDEQPETEDRNRRRVNYRAGLSAELLAGAWLVARGYRVLARRARTPLGEIDLIVRKGDRVGFVEVKFRRSFAAAHSATGGRQRQRIRRAADLWLARHPMHQNCDLTFDLVMVVPWRWPRHLVNGL